MPAQNIAGRTTSSSSRIKDPARSWSNVDSRKQSSRRILKWDKIGLLKTEHMKNCLVVTILMICVSGLAITITAQKQQTRAKRSDRWLNYEPEVVSLKGKLVVKRFYGPPNFGEDPKTDETEDMPVLLLGEPVNVRGKNESGPAAMNNESVKNVREMALVLTIPHKNLIGRTVIITGTLFHANTGHHHTAVLMDVQSISAARSQRKQ